MHIYVLFIFICFSNDKEAILDIIVCNYEQNKDEAKATAALEQFIRENPSHISGYKTLATLKLTLQKYPEAVDTFSRVLEINPTDIDALTFIGTHRDNNIFQH